jgi:adenylate cyclase
MIVFGIIAIAILWRRNWQDVTEMRWAIYLALACVANFVLMLAMTNANPDLSTTLSNTLSYTQAILPIFALAFVQAYNHRKFAPWVFFLSLVPIVLLISVDLYQPTLPLVFTTLTPLFFKLVLRGLLWLGAYGLILYGMAREYQQTISPLHRNRLSYLGLALPFLAFHDGIDLMGPDSLVYALAVIFQATAALILTYATFRHDLFDLRDIVRVGLRGLLVTLFAALVYLSAIEALLAILNGADPRFGFVGAIVAALALALFYQPLHARIERATESVFFGRRQDVQAVLQTFSQKLSTQVDLDQFAQEARPFFKQMLGARHVILLLVGKENGGYTLRRFPTPSDGPQLIQLDAMSAITRDLVVQGEPLLQYDMDRLPRFADVAPETLTAFRNLNSEVYVPIQSRNTLIGVWAVGAKVSGDRYTGSDLALLKTLGNQSAVALENARLVNDLRDQMAQMRSMRDYLDSTLASVATGVLTLDEENKIVSFNRAAEGIFRLPSLSVIGVAYDKILPPFQGAEMPLLLARLWAQSAQHLVRDVIAEVSGRGQVHLTIHMSTMRHGNDMVGVAMVIEDMTEQARLEQERRLQEQEARHVRNTFERYVAPTVVERLLADQAHIMLGGERHLITVLFADIHGFTALSEQLPPEELVQVLNGYLSLAAQVVLRYEGTLDKFMGDGMMALFNVPLLQPDHALRAAQVALALQQQITEYVQHLHESQRLSFRIGIHTGEAVVGNIGTSELMNYTAIGDTVNIAKRLQETAENNQILVSQTTRILIEDRIVVRPIGKTNLRGREGLMDVFELIGALSD